MKQAKFVKGIAEGKSPTVSALDAYETESYGTAAVIASENINKPNIKSAIDAVMEKQGITMERIIEPVNKALSATKVVIHGNGEEAFAEVVEDIELQLKGHDRAMKLMTIGMPKDQPGNISINFNQHIQSQREKYNL